MGRVKGHDLTAKPQGPAMLPLIVGRAHEIFINTFKECVHPDEITHVSMLGVPGHLQWRYEHQDGLAVTTPPDGPSEYANCLKLQMRG